MKKAIPGPSTTVEVDCPIVSVRMFIEQSGP